MRYLIYILLIIIVIAASSIGCSKTGSNPVGPNSIDTESAQNPDTSRVMERGTIKFDTSTSTAIVLPDKESSFHYNITGFLRTGCPGGCFKIAIMNFQNGIFTVKMTLENPTSIQVWDVRIFFMGTYDKKILNPDGYSDYYTNVVFVPFIAFAKEDPSRAFPVGPSATDSENLIIDFNGAPNPAVDYLIEASIGGQLPEPVQINPPVIDGVFLSKSPLGGAVITEVLDHQGDAIVTVDATQIGLGNAEPMFDDGLHGDKLANDGIFGSMRLIPQVDPGIYTLTIIAADPTTYPTINRPFNIKVYPVAQLIHIPEGQFQMGCSDQDPYFGSDPTADEVPLHVHPTGEYYIGKYEVTVGEYAAFVEDNGYFKQQYWGPIGWAVREDLALIKPTLWDNTNFCGPGKLNNPMVGLCWYEAEAYCRWLSQVTGETYRLPSEAEWERAARGDSDDRSFPWGGYSWDAQKCNNTDDSHTPGMRTSPVGLFSPQGDSPWGCADIAGNAEEWVNDWYNGGIYTQYASGDFTPPSSGTYKIVRGGVWWWNNPLIFRCSFRYNRAPVDFDDGNGLRLVKVLN